MEKIVNRFQVDGYWHCQNTEWWKQQCSKLPCSKALKWETYETKADTWEHKGKYYVIQLWKGHCQKFLDQNGFPGGYGAEVGLYEFGELYWLPCLDPIFEMSFKLSFTGLEESEPYVFLDNASVKTWWQTEWIEPESYNLWLEKHGGSGNAPYVMNMKMNYTINGHDYVWG